MAESTSGGQEGIPGFTEGETPRAVGGGQAGAERARRLPPAPPPLTGRGCRCGSSTAPLWLGGMDLVWACPDAYPASVRVGQQMSQTNGGTHGRDHHGRWHRDLLQGLGLGTADRLQPRLAAVGG